MIWALLDQFYFTVCCLKRNEADTYTSAKLHRWNPPDDGRSKCLRIVVSDTSVTHPNHG